MVYLLVLKREHKVFRKTGLSKVEENDEESGNPSNDTPKAQMKGKPMEDLPTDNKET